MSEFDRLYDMIDRLRSEFTNTVEKLNAQLRATSDSTSNHRRWLLQLDRQFKQFVQLWIAGLIASGKLDVATANALLGTWWNEQYVE